MSTDKPVKDRNILIRDIPEDVNNILNVLALLKGRHKWEITRAALIEYVEKHKQEIAGFADFDVKKRRK